MTTLGDTLFSCQVPSDRCDLQAFWRRVPQGSRFSLVAMALASLRALRLCLVSAAAASLRGAQEDDRVGIFQPRWVRKTSWAACNNYPVIHMIVVTTSIII